MRRRWTTVARLRQSGEGARRRSPIARGRSRPLAGESHEARQQERVGRAGGLRPYDLTVLSARPRYRWAVLAIGVAAQGSFATYSQGLAALSNVSGHELSEARTDPTGLGWFDASGEENGDKCAWTFNVPLVTFSNRSKWKIQGEWSNAAYNAGTGYSNSSGQKGCLDGR